MKLMVNEKQQIITMLNTLPDDTTLDDAFYTEYIHSKIKKSEEDMKNGRVMTLQELKEYIEGLEEKYATDNIK